MATEHTQTVVEAQAPADLSDTDYLTPGKRYPVTQDGSAALFSIVDDTGDKIYCSWLGCAHLSGGDWIRVPSA